MRFGVCTKLNNLQTVIDAGYDYIEPTLTAIADMSEEEFTRTKEMIAASPIRTETTNLFFPGSIKLMGKECSMETIADYCQKALSRAAELGVSICVLGSGRSRNVPEGIDRRAAEEQLCKAFSLVGDIAAKNNIIVAIEPLNARETNMINTVAEGIAFCRRVNHPNVRCLADYYHVLESGESLEAIENSEDLLVHCHLAVVGRLMPANAEDAAHCRRFAAALKKCGYDGRISLEGHFDDFAKDIVAALPILKETF